MASRRIIGLVESPYFYPICCTFEIPWVFRIWKKPAGWMKPLLWTPWRKGFARWSVPPWWNATAAVLRQQRRFPRRRCPPWRRRRGRRPRWRPRPRRKRWSFSRRFHGLQVITTWFDSLFDSTSSKWFFEKTSLKWRLSGCMQKDLGPNAAA